MSSKDDDRRSAPRPFEGRGHWLDLPLDQREMTHNMRCNQVRGFCRENRIHFPEEFIEVLAYCGSKSELWFIYPILTISGWTRVGERSLSNEIYRLNVKEPIGSDRVDVLLEDFARGLRIVFEIQGSQTHLPGRAAATRARLNRIQSQVDKLFAVPSMRAKFLGTSFRRDLMREQIARMKDPQFGLAPPSKQKLRIWHTSDLGYDVSSVPIEERASIVSDWVRTRGFRETSGELAQLLARCDRAGEVLFMLQLLTLPNYVISSDCATVSFHNLYRLHVQPMVEFHQVDFLMEPISSDASRGRYLIEINPPPHHPRDVTADEQKDNQMRKLGYQVERESAEYAKRLGYYWRQIIAGDVISLDK